MPREGSWLPPQYERRLKVYASLAALALILTMGIAFVAFLVSFSWPEAEVGSPAARVYAGTVDQFEVGLPVKFPEGKFWLVKQADGHFIALSWSDPRNGCTIPWREGFEFRDPQTGRDTRGWFREPCHGSTYNVDGVRVFGPSSRDMGRYPIEIVGDKIFVMAGPGDLILGASHDPNWPNQ